MSRLIDADAFEKVMYHEAFETDSELQKWDSGCWIRYKMFENAIENFPTADVVPVVHGHWENVPLWAGSDKRILFRCSKCMGPSWTETAYCSNCGSKMDEKVSG